MTSKKGSEVYVDKQGRIIIPKELARCFGFAPGSSVPVTHLPSGLLMRRQASNLAKVYIEPTTRCNLSCRTCVRSSVAEHTRLHSGNCPDRHSSQPLYLPLY